MRANPIILFNASVVLSGLASPSGGSGKLLGWVQKRNVKGLVSEVILNEVMSHRAKLSISVSAVDALIKQFTVTPPPGLDTVRGFEPIVVDVGDAHVLASAKEQHVKYLVTLDKKHLFVLQKKIRTFLIVSPKELILKLEHGAG